ncbi:MAG TPA: glycosyltransferase family 4 protein [Thermomicrobiales bacterium]|nr:glycosyltransferase family 4 protein [Thermomicrobiales bacterium]
MRRLRILTWPIHGSYFNTLTRLDHDWLLPVKPGGPEGYGGRGDNPFPPSIQDVPAESVLDTDLDLVLFQSDQNLDQDALILSPSQRRLPRIYLEHNTPFPHPFASRHPFADSHGLLVHVTRYNKLMWDNGQTATRTIEHSVAIDPTVTWEGTRPEGITAINSMPRRGRKVGLDLLLEARRQVPIQLAGFGNDGLDGLGDIPYSRLHRTMAEYRFLFSPCRYTSLPLAVIEALTIGMPVVALATTELPDVIRNGVHGYLSNDLDELIAGMRRLIDDPDHARELGANARELAAQRFGLDRFARDWDAAFAQAIDLAASSGSPAPTAVR